MIIWKTIMGNDALLNILFQAQFAVFSTYRLFQELNTQAFPKCYICFMKYTDMLKIKQ